MIFVNGEHYVSICSIKKIKGVYMHAEFLFIFRRKIIDGLLYKIYILYIK